VEPILKQLIRGRFIGPMRPDRGVLASVKE
jgi:hypothetical protein